MNTDQALRKKVTKWLEEAYETDDDRTCEALARNVLSVSPDNPEALLLLAEVFQGNEQEYQERLRHVLEVLRRPEADWLGLLSEGCLPEWLKAASLQRLAFSLLGNENSSEEELSEALSLSGELVDLDPEGQTLGRLLRYGALLRLGRYREALKEAMADQTDSPERAYTKALASFRLSGPCSEAYQALCSAIRLDPDLPFLMTGIWEMDDEPSEESDRAHAMALVFGPLLEQDERTAAWFNTPFLLFGFLTDRLPEDMAQSLEPQLEEAGMADILKMAQGQLEALLQQDAEQDPDKIDNLAADILTQIGDF